MNPTIDKVDPASVAKLMQGLGMCLFYYQQIEFHLKLILPQIQKPGASVGQAVDFNWRSLLDSRVTLGQLVEMLKDKVQTEEPEGLSASLRSLVEQRNELVHHLLTDPNRPLSSQQDVERAIDSVRARMRVASHWLRMFRSLTTAFGAILDAQERGDFQDFEIELGLPIGLPRVMGERPGSDASGQSCRFSGACFRTLWSEEWLPETSFALE